MHYTSYFLIKCIFIYNGGCICELKLFTVQVENLNISYILLRLGYTDRKKKSEMQSSTSFVYLN